MKPRLSDTDDFAALLAGLADLYAAEGRPGGDEAATALRSVMSRPFTLPPALALDISGICVDALKLRPHPLAATALSALPLLRWRHSGLESGMIRRDIALNLAGVELIGPDGMVHHATVRVGLFMQTARLDYVTRTHPAEETFIMLGGSGYWTCNGSAPTLAHAGAIIHHPSGAPHATVTRAEPLIAAWRWTGDIRMEGYQLVG